MPKHKGRGPLSVKGGAAKQSVFRPGACLELRVTRRDSAACGRGLPALLSPHSVTSLLADPGAAEPCAAGSQAAAALFLALASGSDCVLACRAAPGVPAGCIELDEVQMANLRLVAGEVYSFAVFDPHEQAGSDDVASADAAGGEPDGGEPAQQPLPVELVDVEAEVRLLPGPSSSSSSSSSSSDGGPVEVDARELARALVRQCTGRMLAVNEYVALELPGAPPLLLRVTAANVLSQEQQAAQLVYHCYRGLLTPDTQVFLCSAAPLQPEAAPAAAADQAQHQEQAQDSGAPQPPPQQQLAAAATPAPPQVQSRLRGGHELRLLNAVPRAQQAQQDLVNIHTSDGELFPVKKRLLRPCIALTKAVRDSGESAPDVAVPIDTLTFDRVLLFLEAQALRRAPPTFAIHLLDDLQQAAEHLGLRSLAEHCASQLGQRAAALQVYSFADVQRANASGKSWLLLDGMVLDVTRWLPEHPGGATIIPRQSLNVDCSRFFELYHASRESFLYLQSFYVGELRASDRPHVPLGGRHAASGEFMAQLREFTAFRPAHLLAQAARGGQRNL